MHNPLILEIQDILVSSDIITENFCCDLSKCRGRCCIEGEAGAPVTLEEVSKIEENIGSVRHLLDQKALEVIERQGVSYTDAEGCLVTSIVNGKDCVFTCYDDIEIDGETITNCCLCSFERNCSITIEDGRGRGHKPMSCYLYPIREKTFSNGVTALNYNRWDICKDAVKKGNELGLPVYRFLKDPLIRRFGKEWYDELCAVAEEIKHSLSL